MLKQTTIALSFLLIVTPALATNHYYGRFEQQKIVCQSKSGPQYCKCLTDIFRRLENVRQNEIKNKFTTDEESADHISNVAEYINNANCEPIY